MAENKDAILNETTVEVKTPLVDAATMKAIQARVGKLGNITEAQAREALDANGNDVKAASQALRDGINKARFSKFVNQDGDDTNWKQNSQFIREANQAVNDALASLPDALILVQEIFADADIGVYSDFLNKVFGPLEMIGAGAGKTFVKEFLQQVIIMNQNNYIPQTRNDVDNYSKVCKVELVDEIKQAWLSVSPWLYVKYFLSGKVDEYVKVALTNLAKNILMKQFFDCIELLKTMWATLYARSASAAGALTNHIEGTKTGYLDALQEREEVLDQMEFHNTRFMLASDTGVPYTSCRKSELIHIVDIQTMETAKKYVSTFLTDKGISEYFKNWIVVPAQGYSTFSDPDQSIEPQITPVNIFVDDHALALTGCVLTLNPKDCVRIANLVISNMAEFPFNLTSVHSTFSRYNQAILPWCSCMIYHNEALVSDFIVPVQTTSNKK